MASYGGKEVQHRLAAPHVGEEVSDRELALPLLVSFHISAHRIFFWAFDLKQTLKNVVPRLRPARAPPALSGGSALIQFR